MLTPEFEKLSLLSVAEGELENLFQEGLIETSDVFENAERYESTKDDVTTVKLVLEIEFSRQAGASMVDTMVRYSAKKPKRKRVGRSVFYSAGEFTATKVRQPGLFDNVHPLHANEEPAQ